MAFLYAAGLWLGVHYAFVAIMAAKRLELTRYWKVMLFPLAVVGLVLDVLFNLTFGSVMYLELPRELLFTKRCQRHIKGSGSRQRMAAFWQRQLNLFDPGHV
jgi:uncharacterized protein (DUF2062 family)